MAASEKPTAGLDERSRLEYESTRLEYRTSLKLKLAEANRALRQLGESVPVETERCRRAEIALKDVEVQRGVKQAELDEVDRGLREVREILAGVAGQRARTLCDAMG